MSEMLRVVMDNLFDVLSYDPDTGLIRWSCDIGSKIKAGDVAGNVTDKGYIKIACRGIGYKAHRVAWLLTHGVFPAGQIDHINGKRCDNRIENLRDVSRSQNSKNTKIPSTNTSGILGVSFYKPTGKWMAQIQVDGEKIFLGYHKTKELAAEARINANKKYGFHKNHGRSK